MFILVALTSAATCVGGLQEAQAAELRIRTHQGDVVYRDSAACSLSDCRRYSSAGDLTSRHALVRAEEAGVVRFFSVDRLGGEIRALNGTPRMSPSRAVFITSSFDEMNGAPETDGTFVWSFGSDGLLLLDRHIPVEELADPEFLRWVGNDCAEMRGFEGWGTNRRGEIADFSIRRQAGAGWRLSRGSCNQ